MLIQSSALRIAPLLLAASFVFAADKIDLARETSVAGSDPIPVADFFRPDLLRQPVLNPLGTHVAAVVTSGADSHQLLVYELDSKKTATVGMPGDHDLSGVHWLTNDRLIFHLSTRKLYGVGLMAADIHSLSRAYALIQYQNSQVIAVPPGDRLHPFVWNRYDAIDDAAQRDLGVSVVDANLKSGEIIDLLISRPTDGALRAMAQIREQNLRHTLKTFPVPPGDHTIEYLNDIDGQLDFAITAVGGLDQLQHFAGDHWERCPVDLEAIDVIATGNHHGQLVVLAPREPGKPRALRYLDGASGELGAILFQDAAYDFYSGGLDYGWLYRDPVKHQILGAVFSRSGPQVVWFTEEYLALQKILEGYFPGLVVRILGSDEAQRRFLVSTSSDRQPAIYQWVDLEKRTAGLFKRSAPWIDPTRMQPMTPIKFKTRDGHRLEAYLTLPAGATKQNPPPLVVLPHGGPWARDTWGFNGEVQFLASRGYAVLQPNYRGSNGYDWMFPESDAWDFAKMHDDVTDATKALAASGLVDKDRIAIMGSSFGGYLAISGVVNEPGLYRCAVTNAGVFDWAEQILSKKYDQYDSPVFAYMMRKLGDPKKEPAIFEPISPGRHVDKIKVPVFVAGGASDQTVEITQSRDLISALKKYNVPYESYIVTQEGHGMHHLDNEVELYTRIEAFLAKNLAKAP